MRTFVLPSLLRLLRCENSGNVAVIFALALIPMLLFMGGGLDLVRYNRYKWELTNVVDAAAVALGREGNDVSEAEAQAFMQSRIAAFGVTDRYFSLSDVNVQETDTGFVIDVHGTMDAMFLPISEGPNTLLPEMQVDIVAEVVRASNRLELALVLDNTGSMNCAATVSSSCTGNWSNPGSTSRIAGLKVAAHSLVDSLMTPNAEEPDFIKIALVPFEGTVNIGAAYAANPPWWVDWNDQAKAKYTGRNLASYDFGGAIGVQRVGHKWLFNRLTATNPSVKWEGCVEMRAEPYDLTDEPPAAGTPNTLFVPFLWPDEPDDDNDSGQSYQNNYLLDATTSDGAAAQSNVTKFVAPGWQSAADTTFPFTSGPNYGCPRPILPLTNNKTAIDTAIDNMVAYPAMGTFIPNGLIWGWHVLSPTDPFTEGVGPANDLYDDTIKAIVLLSDGENSIAGTSNHNRSVFNGYNYTGLQVNGAYRLGSSSASTATTNLNAKTATLCQNVKNAKIRLYTITFGTIPTAAKDLMRNCASVYKGETLYYHAPTNEELATAFNEIGKHLNELHVAR